jgi:hypothetical protein
MKIDPALYSTFHALVEAAQNACDCGDCALCNAAGRADDALCNAEHGDTGSTVRDVAITVGLAVDDDAVGVCEAESTVGALCVGLLRHSGAVLSAMTDAEVTGFDADWLSESVNRQMRVWLHG